MNAVQCVCPEPSNTVAILSLVVAGLAVVGTVAQAYSAYRQVETSATDPWAAKLLEFIIEEFTNSRRETELFKSLCTREFPSSTEKIESKQKLMLLRDETYRRLDMLEQLWPSEMAGLQSLKAKCDGSDPGFFDDGRLIFPENEAAPVRKKRTDAEAAYLAELGRLVRLICKRKHLPK